MKSLLLRAMQNGIIYSITVGMIVVNAPVFSSAAALQQAAGVIEPETALVEPTGIDNDTGLLPGETEPITVDTVPAAEDSEAVDGMTMLYIAGGAALAVGVAVLAGSSGGDDDPVTPVAPVAPEEPAAPEPTVPPVGPDLNGDWSGFLQIKQKGSEGYQGIVASIVHQGTSIKVSTSSTLDYGRYFAGTISSSGYILMYDSTTGEDWTTHKGNASTTQMDMYDYVNNFKDLDRMLLTR